MRFGLLQEAETEIGSTHYFRYRELVREVRRAEEMGFDYWGTSEQHFVSPLPQTSGFQVFQLYRPTAWPECKSYRDQAGPRL